MYKYGLVISFKIENKRNGDSLVNLAELKEHATSYPTRSAEHWTVPLCHNNYSIQSLKYTLSTILNSIIKNNIDIIYVAIQELRTELMWSENE